MSGSDRRSSSTWSAERAAAFASIGTLRYPADAAEFTLKFADDLPPDHPTNAIARDVAVTTAVRSKGRVAMQVFPTNQLGKLGNDTQMISQLRSGAILFMAVGDNILATLVPAAAINNIGFAWPDAKAAFRALDGDLGAYIAARSSVPGFIR